MQKRISTIPFTDTPEQHQKLLDLIDLVARQPDDPLDVVEGGVLGEAEDHHVAPLGLVHLDDLLVDHRQADAVGEFIDQDEVADL